METVLGFLLPYGVIISSYVCILRRIRNTRFRRRIRSEKLILVIVVSFGLFWLPYHIINMVQVCVCYNPLWNKPNKTNRVEVYKCPLHYGLCHTIIDMICHITWPQRQHKINRFSWMLDINVVYIFFFQDIFYNPKWIMFCLLRLLLLYIQIRRQNWGKQTH